MQNMLQHHIIKLSLLARGALKPLNEFKILKTGVTFSLNFI